MKKVDKVDIFEVFNKINKNDIEYFVNLSEKDKKSLASIVLLRWLCGTTDKNQILNLNQYLNKYVFKLYNHQDLLFKIMIASTSGKSQRYKWLKKEITVKTPNKLDIIKRYHKCTTSEARKFLNSYSKEEIIEIAEAFGEDKKFIDQLNNE